MSISAKPDGEHVAIMVQVGEKRARLRVTREYAKALAAELLSAAGAEAPQSGVLDSFVRASENVSRDRAQYFARHLTDALRAKGHKL